LLNFLLDKCCIAAFLSFIVPAKIILLTKFHIPLRAGNYPQLQAREK
jgi:hypothetical protein